MPPSKPLSPSKARSDSLGWSWVRHDVLSSLVVFLVALPLCMGIAVASGVPVAAGLVTGIIGGLVVGALSGSPLQVSGPAAGLTVIVFDLVQKHGLETLGIIVLLAGVLQIVAGLVKVAPWFRAVSPAVVQGMLSGIGVLIFANQFHVMVDDAPKGTGWNNLVSIPEAVQKGLPWPSLGSLAEREARTAWLRKVGTLHDDQVRLGEFVGEVVPHDSRSATDLPSDALRELEEPQARVTAELTELRVQIRDVLAGTTDGSRAEETLGALEAAITASSAASAALNAANVEGVTDSQSRAAAALLAVENSLKNHEAAAKVGILTIICIMLWPALAWGRLKVIPPPLVAIFTATIVAAAFTLPVLYVEVPDRLSDDLHLPAWNVLAHLNWADLLGMAALLAAVASAETLLCCTAVDQMQTEVRTNYDRELFAQGVGNVLCGCLGALPMTGVIVRCAANVQAGAKSRCSTIMHGLWLLVFVAFLSSLLRLIPTSALAAMLVHTGFKLMNFKVVKQLSKFGWGEVAVYFATVGTIVLHDLLTGVIVGIVFSAAKLLIQFAKLDVSLHMRPGSQAADLHLRGAATFLRLPLLAAELERVPPGAELHVHIDELTNIDHACFQLLMDWQRAHEAQGGRLVLDWEKLVASFGAEHHVPLPNAPPRKHVKAPAMRGDH